MYLVRGVRSQALTKGRIISLVGAAAGPFILVDQAALPVRSMRFFARPGVLRSLMPVDLSHLAWQADAGASASFALSAQGPRPCDGTARSSFAMKLRFLPGLPDSLCLGSSWFPAVSFSPSRRFGLDCWQSREKWNLLTI